MNRAESFATFALLVLLGIVVIKILIDIFIFIFGIFSFQIPFESNKKQSVTYCRFCVYDDNQLRTGQRPLVLYAQPRRYDNRCFRLSRKHLLR